MVSTIAVGVDGSKTAAEALEMAVEIARRFDASVVLLSALRDSAATSADLAVDSVELDWAFNPSSRVQQMLAKTQSDLRRDGVQCRTLVDEGEPGDVLVRLAEECGADILVVGNKGMHRRVLGSVPNTVAHKAGCAVLIVNTS
jgi:nucleotide-binding universal stress UspA family protein